MPLFDLSTVKTGQEQPKAEPKKKEIEHRPRKRVKRTPSYKDLKEVIQKDMDEPKQIPDVTMHQDERLARACKINGNVKDIYGCQRCWDASMSLTKEHQTRASCGNENHIEAVRTSPDTGAE